MSKAIAVLQPRTDGEDQPACNGSLQHCFPMRLHKQLPHETRHLFDPLIQHAKAGPAQVMVSQEQEPADGDGRNRTRKLRCTPG